MIGPRTAPVAVGGGYAARWKSARTIDPGRVFDLALPCDRAAEGYRTKVP